MYMINNAVCSYSTVEIYGYELPTDRFMLSNRLNDDKTIRAMT